MKIFEKILPRPRPRPRKFPRKPRSRKVVVPKFPGAGARFTLRTRLGRATGVKSNRYPCDTVRVLATPKRDRVVLQATDGKQAVCLITPGQVNQSSLVPGSVLPTRQGSRDVEVRLDRGGWQSSEGKRSQVVESDADEFPSIAKVLPTMKGKSKNGPRHITLGIDVSLLSRVADSFGTTNLTLLITPESATQPDANTSHINRAVAICPADDEAGTHGIAVVMPFATPKHTAAYYEKIRREIVAAESCHSGKTKIKTVK